MSTPQINYLQAAAIDPTPSRSFLETIAYKKVNDIALSCFESLVNFFLNIFSCCYPDYERIYDTEITRKTENSRNRIEAIKTRSPLHSPVRLATMPRADSPRPRLEPRPILTEPLRPLSPVARPNAEPQRAQRDAERPPAIIRSVIIDIPVARASSAPSNPMLQDNTLGKIAELRTSEETRADGKPYQYLFLKSEQTHHKVILCPYKNDQPIKTHFDLSEGDVIDVSEGLWTGQQKQILIFVKNDFKVKRSYTIDLPPQPIDYRDPNGEKVYITEIVNLQFNEERLSAVFPNMFPPIAIEEGALITPLQRKGALYDFTEESLAVLVKSEEPHPENEEPFESLAVIGRIVLRYKKDAPDFPIHFDFHDDEDALVIKDRGKSSITIEERTGPKKEIQNSFVLNLKMEYQRTYKNANGDTCTEDIYITNIGDKALENDEALRKKFSLVWPPAR